jgi:zinc transporter
MTFPTTPDNPDENGILFAYALKGDGTGHRIEGAEIAALLGRDDKGLHPKKEDLVWVHMDARHEGTRAWLEQAIGHFDPFIINSLLAEETRPRLVEFENGIQLILRGVNLNPNADPEDMVSLRLWVDGYRIITMRRRRVASIDDMLRMIESGRGPREAGDFLSMLCVSLLEKMEKVLIELDDETDDLEESLLEKPDKRLRGRVVDVRMKALTLRRYIAPQRDVVMHLRVSEKKWISIRDKRHMQESVDKLTRYIEDLDAIRERSQILKDELTYETSERLNRNTFLLSIVAAIFLPLTFITGLLGMNVAGIPFAQHSDAFIIVCVLSVLLAVFEVWLFRKMKWF